MSTKSSSLHPTHTTNTTNTPAPAVAPAVTPPAPAGSVSVAPAAFAPLPPADAKIPIPPDDFSPAAPGEFRTVVPRRAELTALPRALADLTKFTNYDQILGATAPPLVELLAALKAGSAWSSMRRGTRLWDTYCVLEEGLAWRMIRTQLDTLRPSFALAVKRDPKLAESYAGLDKLLRVPATVAQAGASTRVANKKATAEGKLPTHGKAGKARLRAAEKAALASSSSTAPKPVEQVAPQASSPVAPAGTPGTAESPSPAAHS
ncbi:MAG TPA: hypothetical protein VGI39_31405 [Polyangiaceae bacterium]|jgi:hypothetical protein